jgi:hypothetical protein
MEISFVDNSGAANAAGLVISLKERAGPAGCGNGRASL